jgi:hypothetical protein
MLADLKTFKLDVLATYRMDIHIPQSCEEAIQFLLQIPDCNLVSMNITCPVLLVEYLARRTRKVPFTMIITELPNGLPFDKLSSVGLVQQMSYDQRLIPLMYTLKEIVLSTQFECTFKERFNLALQETSTLRSIRFRSSSRSYDFKDNPDVERVHHMHVLDMELHLKLDERLAIRRLNATLIIMISKQKDVAREIAKQIIK